MKKRVLSLILLFALLLSCCGTSFAYTEEEQRAAEKLYTYGLFRGKGTNMDGTPKFDLDGSVTRGEAITMVVRMMGEEETALNSYFGHPFTDASWADAYIGYAYANGITNGTSATLFSTNTPVTMSQFLTLLLRALGYTEVDWKNPYPTADRLWMEYPDPSVPFDRGAMVLLCREAMDVRVKGVGKHLYVVLSEKGVLYKKPVAATQPLPTIPASGKLTVSTREEVDAALAAFGLTGRMDYLMLTVPSGEREAYTDYVRQRYHSLIPDSFGLSMMLKEYEPDVIYVQVDYHDSGRIRGYLRGLTKDITEEDRLTLEAARAIIARIITPEMTDYRRVEAIHDYILDHTEYTNCAYDNFSAFEAAGPLRDGIGVCDGYACAFQLLCLLADIPCSRRVGEVRTGSHAWNVVYLEGKWYHVDCTWDDTGTSYAGSDREYFLLGDESMSRSHEWLIEPGQNKCPENYFG